ncbi:MAG: HIT domain-containing protein [Oscillospiraceae bacterium]|jgi:histidine triad (HIT) family protein|nr:HIT domain-containing protein [Oscillospiraceae bacterium]
MECIFCKIFKKEINTKIIFEDDLTISFEDLNPVAPFHILIIPKKHIDSVNEINENNSIYIKQIFENIPKIVLKFNLKDYRIVSNIGPSAGQSVMHMHFHILGNRKMNWPPG